MDFLSALLSFHHDREMSRAFKTKQKKQQQQQLDEWEITLKNEENGLKKTAAANEQINKQEKVLQNANKNWS